MRKYGWFILGVLLFLAVRVKSQNSNSGFPEAWLGTWTGELHIFSAKGLMQKIPMGLEILKTDTPQVYTWNIIYGPDRASGLRPYRLKPVDPAKGHWVVDEGNNILLDTYLLGNELISAFSVQGGLLYTTSVLREDGKMDYVIYFGNDTPVSETGGGTYQGEEIPKVKSFPVKTLQKAVLTRQPVAQGSGNH